MLTQLYIGSIVKVKKVKIIQHHAHTLIQGIKPFPLNQFANQDSVSLL